MDYDKDKVEGAELEVVRDGSPAKKAGLKVGDIIIKVGDKDVNASRDLTTLIGKLRPGSKAKLKLLRDKKEMEIEVTLGSRPAAQPRLPFGFPPRK